MYIIGLLSVLKLIKFSDVIVRTILRDENPVENISKWADKNLDKLDKCLVIQNGQWFAKGELHIYIIEKICIELYVVYALV